MDSITAFQSSQALSKTPIVSVRKAGTSNTVWICASEDQNEFAIKDFPKDEHGREHFFAESGFLDANRGCHFLPELIAIDEANTWIATKFYAGLDDSQISLDGLLDIVSSGFQGLSIPFEAHSGLPGVLAWDYDNTDFVTPTQRVILFTLLNMSWFSDAQTAMLENWDREAISHSDLKLQNVILSARGPIVIDWEHVSRGRSEWDLAGILQSVVASRLARGGDTKWSQRHYQRALEILEGSSEVVRSAASLRLAQTAMEISNNGFGMTRQAANALQAAAYVQEGRFDLLVIGD